MINLIKLSVGSESVADLVRWQESPRAQGPDGLPRHVTRVRPKRAEEVLAGGSIYWVIRGAVLCRQEVLRLDEVEGSDGLMRCGIVLRPGPVPVTPALRRPFQGWRYLAPGDAPRDANPGASDEPALPPALSVALAEIGIL
jgi:hypothetical protein